MVPKLVGNVQTGPELMNYVNSVPELVNTVLKLAPSVLGYVSTYGSHTALLHIVASLSAYFLLGLIQNKIQKI